MEIDELGHSMKFGEILSRWIWKVVEPREWSERIYKC